MSTVSPAKLTFKFISQGNSDLPIWLGGNKLESNTWVWTHGDPVTGDLWSGEHADDGEDCLLLENGHWMSRKCIGSNRNKKFSFLAQSAPIIDKTTPRPPAPTSRPRPTTTTTTTTPTKRPTVGTVTPEPNTPVPS